MREDGVVGMADRFLWDEYWRRAFWGHATRKSVWGQEERAHRTLGSAYKADLPADPLSSDNQFFETLISLLSVFVLDSLLKCYRLVRKPCRDVVCTETSLPKPV